MNKEITPPLRTTRSFVIREGRLTAAQKRALDELWPRYGISNSAGTINYDQYFLEQQPVVLDVGFGNGDSLISLAQQRSDLNFIGVEVYRQGIGNVLRQLEASKIENVRIVNADVLQLLEVNMCADFLQGMMVWFPDPWPKKRHHKRRLVQTEFLQQAITVLKSGSVLHLASDWQPYVDVMRESAAKCEQLTSLISNEHPLKLTRPLPRFEKRGLRLGHKVTDLIYLVNK